MFEKDIINNDDISHESIDNEDTKNKDITNEDITNEDITNEDITNEDITSEEIVNEEIVNEEIVNEDIVNKDIINEDITSEDITSEDIVNKNIINEDIVNKDNVNEIVNEIVNEDIVNEDITSKDIAIEDIKKEKIEKKDIQKEDIKKEKIEKENIQKEDIKNVKNKNEEGIIKFIFLKFLKVFKWIGIVFVSIILLLLSIRAVGKAINKRTPVGGINESMYVDINNTKQWISIYGQDINNPVILYLHGGPGEATSYFDNGFLRKWSDIYTVVSWDQRDCGLSFKKDQKDIPYTHELFMQDGLEMTKFLTQYLHKDKIILIGHSWGTAFGSNLSLNYPEYYQYYIGTGQIIDMKQNEKAFVEAAKEWSKGDEEGEKLVSQLDINNRTLDYYFTRYKVMSRYGYHGLAEKPDYNIIGAIFFNPYYSLWDLLKLIFSPQDLSKYMNFLSSDEFDNFSLLNRTKFPIPFYNILGDHDYQTNRFQAEEYFNSVNAPRKKLYMMKDMNHGLLEIRSNEFSDLMHDINKLEQAINSKSTTTN